MPPSATAISLTAALREALLLFADMKESPVCHTSLAQVVLCDLRFYRLLSELDADLASEARAGSCPRCGGRLDSATYPRKPRGGPCDLGEEYQRRWSLCCAVRGCRHRVTPPSVRFLGRKVYLGAVVVLVSALRYGPTPPRRRS